uniref:PH domain-containing protein n=1 Tax=Phaeocystis antarctica TaxID=33657 RepID=A0A7S0NEA3_9EUKA|mmetsp:Transcript_553/g.1231  ORF Transcript_553/g.1231 Transcript_553/m.1231 type:complete len:148 (+) Transcript_553:2-445(+)
MALVAPVMTPRNQEPATEAHGKRLYAGMVERATTVVGSVRYVKRFAVLYSDPFLGLFTDESAAEPKGSRSVAGATATHDGEVVEIAVPNENSDVKLSIKLRTSTIEEAQAWAAKINLVCSTTAPLSPEKGNTGAWLQHASSSKSIVT